MGTSVKIYARIGELMQGRLLDGRAFMVSGFSSTQWYSDAWLDEEEGTPLPPKACKALSLLLEKAGVTPGDMRRCADLDGKRVRLRSNIPAGKGLSSSSTDILSVLSLVNGHLGMGLPPEDLYALAAQVEPTDPCLSDDILLFYQHSGVVGKRIVLPPMNLLYFDAGPERRIDTGSVCRPWTPGLGRYYDWLLNKFLQAADAADYDTLFECITASAEYNQTVVSLPRWEEWLQLAKEFHCGLMVAHTGTIAGLLTPPERTDRLRARLEVAAGVPVFVEHY